MPPFDWQLIVVLALIAGAAFVVARRVWQLIRPASSGQGIGACGSCGNCGASSETPAATRRGAFVPVDSLTTLSPADKQS